MKGLLDMNYAKKLLILGALAAFAMNLASCGSGSSSAVGGLGGVSGRVASTGEVQTEFAEGVGLTEASASYATAARKEPATGSVTQTSSGTADLTEDRITVGITGHPDPDAWRSEGTLQIEVTHVTDDVALTSGGNQAFFSDAVDDTEWYTFHYMEGETAGRNPVYVLVAASYYRDSPTAEFDTDWMAGGVWIEHGGGAAVTVGAFADGGNPYEVAPLTFTGVTGTATYVGAEKVFGVYSDGDGNNMPFSAAISLNADFDLATPQISGQVTSFMTEDGTALGITVFLNDANLDPIPTSGDSSVVHVFFTGDTVANFGGEDYAGKWGGQFHGDASDATKPPPRAAGTFGASTGEEAGDKSFVGAWAADTPDP